jgi:hypothetical protein
MTALIAHLDLVFAPPGEPAATYRVGVGAPEPRGGHWVCSVASGPVHPGPAAIAGDDSLQALTLAVGHLRAMLQAFVDGGGRLGFPGDADPAGRPPDAAAALLRAYFGAPAAAANPEAPAAIRAVGTHTPRDFVSDRE